ncbi:hypothetical protein L4923_11650 [Mesorhizobium sp. IRAMC:0171]|uniref:Uncharacterized protein n=1 Tax=Mesorhizobium retamae TaxID=2912854 RepID=A0ABS9QE71_9HYPH|nr:hypothetical protein [Mesorhizobium sp. IRAMC:0171]MCG7505665.1 hypothetical protein [Mesorhizobium sp. IRAMC:0171]
MQVRPSIRLRQFLLRPPNGSFYRLEYRGIGVPIHQLASAAANLKDNNAAVLIKNTATKHPRQPTDSKTIELNDDPNAATIEITAIEIPISNDRGRAL